jgi:hypothetical protein
MKKLVFAVAFLLTAPAYAVVTSVFIWDAPPGGDAAMLQTAVKAKAIHEKLGASVFIGMDQKGRMHYGVSFETAAARGAFFDKAQASEEFAALMNEAAQGDKAGTMLKAYNMNVALGNSVDLKAIHVFRYRPDPGRLGDVIAKMAEAKAIHEKLGASVSVNVDEVGWAHYVLNFASWEAQGKFQDALAGNEAWQAFQASLAEEPIAQLKNVYRVTTVGN